MLLKVVSVLYGDCAEQQLELLLHKIAPLFTLHRGSGKSSRFKVGDHVATAFVW